MNPVWRGDSPELYFIAPDGTLMASPIAVRGTDLAPGALVALFHPRIVGGGVGASLGWQYDVSRDGRFLINTVLGETTAAPITLLQHWNPEARK
ncbi:MAG: hypothetical protein FJW23_07225 [Acidimicrobiia bacterium]|nr:hypothetical protein [Acidimicrobiia bacterium]